MKKYEMHGIVRTVEDDDKNGADRLCAVGFKEVVEKKPRATRKRETETAEPVEE